MCPQHPGESPLHFTLAILCAICVLAVSTCFTAAERCAFAADWSFTPSATLTQSYDSNFRFIATPPPPGTTKGDFITSFTPVASVTGETEETKFQFDTVTSAQAYLENPQYDIVNTNTTTSLTESWSPRFSTSANLGLIHDSTLEDQLQSTGIVTEKVERYVFSGGLEGKYDLNELLNLTASGVFAKIIYPSGMLPDSDVCQATITPVWAVTPRNNVGLSSNYSVNEYNIGTTVRTITETLFWERFLSETLSFKVSGGYYFTRLNYSAQTQEFIPPFYILIVNRPVTENDGGFIFGLDIKQNWSERFSTTLSAGNQQYNDVNARSFDSTFFSGSAQYKLSERTTLNFLARYNLNNQISQGDEKIDYYIINPSIERNLTENLLLRLSASYENESDSDYGNVAGTKAVYNRLRTWIDLTYKWPRFFSSN